MPLVFVPLSAAELSAWAQAGMLAAGHVAHAVTPDLVAAFDLAGPEDEEAEFTCLMVASLAALLEGGRRIVAVADVASVPLGTEFGQINLGEVPYARVTSLFSDDDAGRRAASIVSSSLGQRTLDAAWESAEVTRMLVDHALLWHGPDEWRQVAAEEAAEA